MEISCPSCDAGTASDGNPCKLCGGDGLVDLTDSNFAHYGNHWQLHGFVWDAIFAAIETLQADVTAIKAKTDNLPNDTAAWMTILRNKIDAIKAVVDEL